MKIIKDEMATLKRGRLVTIELEPGEDLINIRDDAYYRLGGQVDEIMCGHVLTELERVYWCSISQKWEVL